MADTREKYTSVRRERGEENLDILSRLIKETPSQYAVRSEEALRWYQEQMRSVRLSAREFMRTAPLNKTRRILTGRFYTYFYQPKYRDILPYYDIFPVTLIIDSDSNSFSGLNFHYLAPRYRVLLLKELYQYIVQDDEEANDMTNKIRITWEILSKTAKLRWAKPCYKKYRLDHVIGPALEITPDQWDVMAMLPLARFKKESIKKVYADSREAAFKTRKIR